MPGEKTHRRLAAILAADVVGFSRLMGRDEVGTLNRVKTILDETLAPKISAHGGRIAKEMGDGLLVEFSSVVDAAQCASEIQEELQRSVSSDRDGQVQFRIGINVGDIIVDGDDVFGDGVNIAARLEALADPGGVTFSGEAHSHLKNKVDLTFEDLGDHRLKNIDDPIRVFRLASSPDTDFRADSSDLFARPSLVVLPLTNLSGDPDQEYFADGLTDDIITALSYWRSFPVIARDSSFAFKGKSIDVQKVAKSLGARYVLQGSVRRAGERVRVSAKLIDTITEHHVWVEKIDGRLRDVFELQDEITEKIAASIVPELEKAERRRLSSQSSVVSAWELYQRGMSQFYKTTKKANVASRQYFRKAIEADPGFGSAYASLAFSYHAEVAIWQAENREAVLSKAIAAATKATELDDTDSYAHAMLGTVYLRQGEHERCLTCCRRAVSLNPSNALAHAILGNALSFAGSPIDGIRSIERALKLNPHDPNAHFYINMIARSYLTAGDHHMAVQYARESIGRRLEHAFAHIVLASALGHLGLRDEARGAINEVERIDPGRIDMEIKILPSVFRNEDDANHVIEGLHKAGWAKPS